LRLAGPIRDGTACQNLAPRPRAIKAMPGRSKWRRIGRDRIRSHFPTAVRQINEAPDEPSPGRATRGAIVMQARMNHPAMILPKAMQNLASLNKVSHESG